MSPAFFDLSARAKIRISGADSFRYLNGQVTNDLHKATATSAIQASLLTAKGKLSAHVWIIADSDGAFLMDADPELRETLIARLERYIIADNVEAEDVTDDFPLFHVMAAGAPTAPWILRAIHANRLGQPGLDLWVKRSDADRAVEQLSRLMSLADRESVEAMRIENGVPRWGYELTEEIIPVEANLEEAAIDYAKGCYIGQEVISRMKMSGQTNKRLRGLVSEENVPLKPGMRLCFRDEPARDVGWVTSATRSARLGKEIALGYVKRGFNDDGTRLLGRSEGDTVAIPARVVPLPFD